MPKLANKQKKKTWSIWNRGEKWKMRSLTWFAKERRLIIANTLFQKQRKKQTKKQTEPKTKQKNPTKQTNKSNNKKQILDLGNPI